MSDENEIKHIVQFSGGKDSTAMLLMMIEKGMRIDEIIFCDTGKEFPQMYDHIKKVEEYIGRPITIIKPDKSFDYYLSEHIKTSVKHKGEVGFGWGGVKHRWCTGLLKVRPVEKHLKIYKNYVSYIAIAYDEPKRHEKRTKGVIHPLYDWKITEKQALEYCYSKGFDWGGLYEDFDRVSCFCCPLQNLKELRTLYHKYPDLWEQLKKMDELNKHTNHPFRMSGESVLDLENRFKKEDLIKEYEQKHNLF